MIDIDRERRRGERIVVRRPCKVFDPRSRKYHGGSTCNVAAGGMLLRVDRSIPIQPGDRVYIGVAPRRHALLRTEELVEADVVRVVPQAVGETLFAVRMESAGAAVMRDAA